METLIVQSGLKRHQEKRYLMGFQFFEGDFQKYFVEHEQQAIKSEKNWFTTHTVLPRLMRRRTIKLVSFLIKKYH